MNAPLRVPTRTRVPAMRCSQRFRSASGQTLLARPDSSDSPCGRNSSVRSRTGGPCLQHAARRWRGQDRRPPRRGARVLRGGRRHDNGVRGRCHRLDRASRRRGGAGGRRPPAGVGDREAGGRAGPRVGVGHRPGRRARVRAGRRRRSRRCGCAGRLHHPRGCQAARARRDRRRCARRHRHLRTDGGRLRRDRRCRPREQRRRRRRRQLLADGGDGPGRRAAGRPAPRPSRDRRLRVGGKARRSERHRPRARRAPRRRRAAPDAVVAVADVAGSREARGTTVAGTQVHSVRLPSSSCRPRSSSPSPTSVSSSATTPAPRPRRTSRGPCSRSVRCLGWSVWSAASTRCCSAGWTDGGDGSCLVRRERRKPSCQGDAGRLRQRRIRSGVTWPRRPACRTWAPPRSRRNVCGAPGLAGGLHRRTT